MEDGAHSPLSLSVAITLNIKEIHSDGAHIFRELYLGKQTICSIMSIWKSNSNFALASFPKGKWKGRKEKKKWHKVDEKE